MFLGFMKRGVGLMGLFFGIMGLASCFHCDFLLFFVPIIWFYSFFDAMNKNALSNEELNELPDHFLWVEDSDFQLLSKQRSRKIIAVAMIFIGCYSLLQMVWELLRDIFGSIPDWLYQGIFYDLPRIVFSLIIIIVGIYLIGIHKPDQIEEE